MLAEKIKQYRMAAGLTQKELAGALNASQNTISQYESGKRTPTVKKLLEISTLLGCSVDELTLNRPGVHGAGEPQNTEQAQ